MTFSEYFESKHKELIEATREEYERVIDPNFIEMGAEYVRIERGSDIITPISFEYGNDLSHHFVSWKAISPWNERDRDATYRYDNKEAPIKLKKIKAGNGQYPPDTGRVKWHMINGEEVRFWSYTSRDYSTKKLSVEVRFTIGNVLHSIRGTSWGSDKNRFLYHQQTYKELTTISIQRNLTLREVKQLVFGDPNYKVNKRPIDEILFRRFRSRIKSNIS